MTLSKNSKIIRAITVTAGAAGTSAINGEIIDTAGYGGCLFVVQLGAIVSNAVTSLKVQQGAAPAMGDAADLAGTSVAVADDDDEKIKYIDVVGPRERYLRLVASRATQNATLSAIAILYNATTAPTTHDTNVAGETHASPAEGTA